jgi:hypothetical protein
VREEVVHVGLSGFDVAAAVEAAAFLVAVERLARSGDRPAAHLAALDDEEVRLRLVGHGQQVRRQVQVQAVSTSRHRVSSSTGRLRYWKSARTLRSSSVSRTPLADWRRSSVKNRRSPDYAWAASSCVLSG